MQRKAACRLTRARQFQSALVSLLCRWGEVLQNLDVPGAGLPVLQVLLWRLLRQATEGQVVLLRQLPVKDVQDALHAAEAARLLLAPG